jgi:hypothetical protein
MKWWAVIIIICVASAAIAWKHGDAYGVLYTDVAGDLYTDVHGNLYTK